MFKPGDLIRAAAPLSLAKISYDERPVKSIFPDMFVACSANTNELAIVIGSDWIKIDGQDTNEIYVMLNSGLHGWSYAECWRSLQDNLLVKLVKGCGIFKR